jgi:hypothetical protein
MERSRTNNSHRRGKEKKNTEEKEESYERRHRKGGKGNKHKIKTGGQEEEEQVLRLLIATIVANLFTRRVVPGSDSSLTDRPARADDAGWMYLPITFREKRITWRNVVFVGCSWKLLKHVMLCLVCCATTFRSATAQSAVVRVVEDTAVDCSAFLLVQLQFCFVYSLFLLLLSSLLFQTEQKTLLCVTQQGKGNGQQHNRDCAVFPPRPSSE